MAAPHGAALYSIQVSPDGQTLVSGSGSGQLQLWHMPTAEARTTFPAHGKPITHVVFSPNGQYLATAAEDGTAKLWDVSR